MWDAAEYNRTSPYNPAVSARFHAPAAQASGDLVTLPDEEAQHLSRVLRLRAGDTVRLFNGRGGEFDGRIETATRSAAQVRVEAVRTPVREAGVAIALAPAVLKGDKMDDVIRDAVMIGVASIHPMVATRSEVTLAALARAHRRERWERIAISSAKQCGRAVVPPIAEPQPFDAVTAAVTALTLPGPALMFVEPAASSDASLNTLPLGELDLPAPQHATAIVGPEGGWTPQEVALGAAAGRLVTLGARTLRADAMPIIAVAALFAVWREF
jgi:16S rRNA (uracil1498-N3)-methyltransferase